MELKKSISRILAVIICLTPFLITPGFGDTYYLIKALFIIASTLLVLVKWILYEKNKRFQLENLSIIAKLAFSYLILIYISTIFSVDILNSLIGISNRWESVITLTCYILLLVFSSLYFDFDNKIKRVLMWSGSIMAFIGILQFFNIIGEINYSYSWGDFAASYGTLGNQNYLGAYITIILPVTIYMYINTNKLLYFLSSGLLYAVMIMTKTRGAWLGMFIAFLFLIFCFYKQKEKYKSFVFISLFFFLITIGLDVLLNGAVILRFLTIIFEFGKFNTVDGPENTDGSNRIYIWTRILKSLPQKPFFGVGVSNLSYIFKNYFVSDNTLSPVFEENVFERAHNEFLHISMTTGIPSGISYTIMIFYTFKEVKQKIKNNPSLIPITASLIAYVAQSLFSNSVISHSYIFWIFLGATIYQINSFD